MRILLLAAAAAVAAPVGVAQAGTIQPAEAIGEADRALQTITETDTVRLFKDKAYAQEILAQVEIARRSGHYSDEFRPLIDRVRMIALAGSGQITEAFAQARELTRSTPGDPDLHFLAFALGVDARTDGALDELEFAARALSEGGRNTFAESLDSDLVNEFRRRFYLAKDKPRIARAALALLDLGWPGPHKLDWADGLRLEAAEGLLAKGDTLGARKLIFSLRTTKSILRTLISRKWDALREAGDPLERLSQSIAASDEASNSALLAKPGDPEIILSRALFLRSVGRESDALQLLLPKAQDFGWVKEQDEDGYWVVNETAYALVALGRRDEAVSLMQRLVALGLRQNPSLISMAINSIGIMSDAGSFGKSAEYATMLATTQSDLASPYGRMWMWAGAVCGHALDDNLAAAQPWLAKLKSGEEDNPAALTRALLCANDLDGAAASVVRRLEGDDPEDMLVALQTYTAGPELPASRKGLEERLSQIKARGDVQAAIARHGRVMTLPLSRSYWGLF